MYSFVEICCLLERTTAATETDLSFSHSRGIPEKKKYVLLLIQ